MFTFHVLMARTSDHHERCVSLSAGTIDGLDATLINEIPVSAARHGQNTKPRPTGVRPRSLTVVSDFEINTSRETEEKSKSTADCQQ